MAIRRNITVLRKGIQNDIDIVYGSDLVPIELYVTDYNIPDSAMATAYCENNKKEKKKIICKISDNKIIFTPENGFFEIGRNRIQIRITNDNKNLISFMLNASCDSNIVTDDAQEVESQPSLVTQILTEIGNVKKETKTHDLKDNVTTFTSSDTTQSPSTWTDVPLLKTGEKTATFFSKISQMFRNIRYLGKKVTELINLMGEVDISTIGTGTVTGIIRDLEGNVKWSEWINAGNTCRYAKCCGMVTVIGNSSGNVSIVDASEGNTLLFTLPQGYRPPVSIVTAGTAKNSNGREMQVTIDTSGEVRATGLSQTTSYWGFAVSFPVGF